MSPDVADRDRREARRRALVLLAVRRAQRHREGHPEQGRAGAVRR